MELAADLTPAGLRDVLAELGERAAPVTLARERTLPVPSAMRPLFPDGGLVRGRIHACAGGGATTMAMAMVAEALVAGSWMAVVDLPTFGAAAADELGVPLERVVRIGTDRTVADPGSASARAGGGDPVGGVDPEVPVPTAPVPTAPVPAAPDPVALDAVAPDPAERLDRWLDVMAAAVDGFDVVLARVPGSSGVARRPGAVRSLVARLQQRGSIVVVVGPAEGLPVDVSIDTSGVWSGLGRGYGVLQRRRLHAVAGGRRHPRRSAVTLDLEVSGRRLSMQAAAADTVAAGVTGIAADDVVLAPAGGESVDGGGLRLVAG